MNVTNSKETKRKEKCFIYDIDNVTFLEEYLKYLKTKELADSTVYHTERSIVVILNYFENNNIKLRQMTSDDIEKYIKSLNNFSPYTKKNYLKYLRQFLKFLYQKGYITENVYLFIPSIKVPSYNHIPNILEDEDIVKIFEVIDRNTKRGKLIYAVLILSVRYGLRLCDIKNLKFENIQWNKRQIKLIQTKTKVELTLPLLEDVADGLIDYIKNSREQTSENRIFVNSKGKKFITENFYDEFGTFIKKANIDLPEKHKKGIYLLRHSLASRLLKKHIPLSIISPILGHTSQMTSMNYIKIDINNLKKCCLEIKNDGK